MNRDPLREEVSVSSRTGPDLGHVEMKTTLLRLHHQVSEWL